MRTLILAVIAALSLNVAQAVEVAGVKFEDKTSLGNASLVANGAGMRKKAFFKVYAMALYLPGKQADAEGVLSAKGAKRIAIDTVETLFAGLSNHGILRAELLKHRYSADIQRISCGSLKSTDTSFAEDDLVIALTENIFGSKKEFFYCSHHSPLCLLSL